MLDIVSKTIAEHNMIQKSERVLVGLSGGADSVSLLLCLLKLGYNVSACHINHQLRGEESLRDEQFCIDFCKKLGVPLEVHRLDVSGYCKTNSCSVEEGARTLRYEIFAQSGFEKIATAHTLSDCIETTVFNLARGTGLKGLCSIPPIRGNIIRPLIDCTRSDIEEFLLQEKQSYVTDSTNLETEYSRNKIRLKLIPILGELNTSLFKTYKNTLANLKNDEDYLELQLAKLLDSACVSGGYNAEILSQAHPALANRAIAEILSENNISVGYERILSIAKLLKNGGKINLRDNIFAVCNDGLLQIKVIEATAETTDYSVEVVFENEYAFFDKNVSFEIIDYSGGYENVNKKLANICCDYDKIIGKVFLRNRKDSDKITLCNRRFTSSVKKLFNSSVPLENRHKVAILEDNEGIIFIEGFGCAERVKIDENTRHILICKVS